MRTVVFRTAFLVTSLFWLTADSSGALPLPGGVPLTARSRSEQFYVYGGNEASPAAARGFGGAITLIPSLTAVSCERVKSALLARLGAVDRWQGRICIVIMAGQAGTGFDLAVLPFGSGWQYRVQAPEFAQPRDFVQAMVRTLLLEMANRTARDRSTEVPYWLAEGLTEEVIASSGVDLVMDVPTADRAPFPVVMRERIVRGDQTLVPAHECLQTNVPLTIQQLSWPDNGLNNPGFRASAQLLVRRLLEKPGGKSAMQRFILGLPANFNWQTTFLKAFSDDFDSLRTLEKWWLLETARFTSRSRLSISTGIETEVLTTRWTAPESWQRLDEILRAPVRVYAESNALPSRSVIRLQTAFDEWAMTPLRALVTAKVQELDALQLRLHFSVVPLAKEYRLLLGSYLNELDRSKAEADRRMATGISLRALHRQIARSLDALDVRRQAQEADAQPDPAGFTPSESPVAAGSGRVP